MRNFFTIDNIHINLDHVRCFSWSGKQLTLHDSNPQPLVFNDPDRTLYKALCNHVGVNTAVASKTDQKLRHRVYAVYGCVEDPILVDTYDSYSDALAMCMAHEWSTDTIISEKDIPKGRALMIETHGC